MGRKESNHTCVVDLGMAQNKKDFKEVFLIDKVKVPYIALSQNSSHNSTQLREIWCPPRLKTYVISCAIMTFMFFLYTARWNHIENLDDFFTRVYHYHQRQGFLCMVLEDVLQLM